jgi:hypothetical protein
MRVCFALPANIALFPFSFYSICRKNKDSTDSERGHHGQLITQHANPGREPDAHGVRSVQEVFNTSSGRRALATDYGSSFLPKYRDKTHRELKLTTEFYSNSSDL